ncbi:MAG: SRPBCC family protein [Dehalococcoidia bacterium]
MVLKDSIKIGTSAEKVFSFLTGLKDTESYKAWHPDHVSMNWIKGEPFAEGSVAYSEEYLHGEIHKAKFVCTRAIPNRLIEYRPPFPLSIFFPGNQFIIEPIDEENCMFTATGRMRTGPLFARLNRRRIEGVKRHMQEEGENLKAIMENKTL